MPNKYQHIPISFSIQDWELIRDAIIWTLDNKGSENERLPEIAELLQDYIELADL